jgi:quercetin dioxygenase-like cupin family protein
MTRRIVTGHDASGKSTVLSDGAAPNVQRRPSGLVSTLLWATDETPAKFSTTDRAAREIGIPPPPRGSIFRVVDFPPAAENPDPMMHRTASIDYGIVLEGEIDLVLDGSEVRMQAGDVLVQQGTVHGWINRGKINCRVAFILIDANEEEKK